jgi:hypothetical protein
MVSALIRVDQRRMAKKIFGSKPDGRRKMRSSRFV